MALRSPMGGGRGILLRRARDILPRTYSYNPYELTRLLEVFDILTVSELILHACIARRASCPPLSFERADAEEGALEEGFIVLRQQEEGIGKETLPLGFWGDLKENYAKHNAGYEGGQG